MHILFPAFCLFCTIVSTSGRDEQVVSFSARSDRIEADAVALAQRRGACLAEYDYVSRPAGDQHHLGFIIEDHPDLPAVQENGIMIDLYAYASMVLATVQVQSQQIEALQQEVERLRALVGVPVCEAPVE